LDLVRERREREAIDRTSLESLAGQGSRIGGGKMRPHGISLSREELYRRVWETPISKLAKEYGVSDVGLAKTCRRHYVPRPPRGYWAKLEHGKPVHQLPLPEISDPKLETVRMHGCTGGTDEASIPEYPEVATLLELKREKCPSITVPKRLSSPHPLVAATRRHLGPQRRDYGGPLRRQPEATLDVRVSPASVARALRLLDAVVKAWERLGGQIRVGSSHDAYAYSRDRKTWAVMDEDQVAFSLFERMRQLPSQKDTSLGIHTGPQYVHSGRQVLRIEGVYGAPRHTWSDGKRQRLEDVLDSFVEGLLRQIGQLRIDRAEKACRARQREKVAERREEEKRRREEEQERRKELETELDRWMLAGRIRTYLTALGGGIESGRLRLKDLKHFERWFAWARWYAECVDPLAGEPEKVEQLRHARASESHLPGELRLGSDRAGIQRPPEPPRGLDVLVRRALGYVARFEALREVEP
jgi:hypothetical protein